MIGKALRLLVLLSIAGSVPYAWFSDGFSQFLREHAASLWSPRPESPKSAYDPSTYLTAFTADRVPRERADSPSPTQSPPTGAVSASPTTPLDEVLRFDVTDQWIIDRWPRVSTILSDRLRKGLRVPLVTGPKLTDLAGSLSYYFDERGRVRRIAFEGHTGDAQGLIDFATKRFVMRAEPTLGAGLYLTRWNALPTNGLRIRHAPVVRVNQPHTRLEVNFEINRPDEGYSLSPEFLKLIDYDRLARQRR